MPACPICCTEARHQHGDSPYHVCPSCDLWFQDPLPDKVWHGPHEQPGDAMGEAEKRVNAELATRLFREALGGTPGPTLDVGSHYPWLAKTLRDLGCDARALDGSPDSAGFAAELGVPHTLADFEAWEADGAYRLVTMIHVFEHMERPLEALRKLRWIVARDGAVFLRLPDHAVPGFERDLTPGHYRIHPMFHTLTSVLQACAETDTFEVVREQALVPGQRDLLLRPLARRPRLTVWTIAKNEERDLPRALRSVAGIADNVVLVDTGSTDQTIPAGIAATDLPTHVEIFTGASELVDGDWKLQDFSAARNRAIANAETTDCDWWCWMDADDELLTPQAIRRALYLTAYDAYGAWIVDGQTRWIHHRLFKAGRGVQFRGACHEYPVLDKLAVLNLDDCAIRHDATPGTGETSNARNLRLLTAEWQRDPSPRTAFYMASTHKDAGRHAEAAEWYRKRIALGADHRDEWLFAHLYGARCLREAGDRQGAEALLADAIKAAPDWAEFYMELAYCAYHAKQYDECIARAARVPTGRIPPTHLWREPSMYRDQPARITSWCFEHLGNLPAALEWAEKARPLIGNPDADWGARIDRLKAACAPAAPAVATKKVEAIALCRPGAIGDILMAANVIPALKEATGLPIYYFCHASYAQRDALGWLLHRAGVDVVMDSAQWDAWRGRFERAVPLIGYPIAGSVLEVGYPHKPMAKHLVEYFAAEVGLAGFPELELTVPRGPKGQPYATLQRVAGWSKYKEWPHWDEVVARLPFPVVELRQEAGLSLEQSIKMLAGARLHLGIDSFAQHATHYLWRDGPTARKVPAVVVFGSTQASASGYPHNVNLSAGLACQPCFRENPAISRQPLGPCVNPPRESYADDTPPACMAAITVDMVVDAARRLWDEAARVAA